MGFSSLILRIITNPAALFAQGIEPQPLVTAMPAVLIAFVFLVFFLSRSWTGIVNITLINHETIASSEFKKPYLPSFFTIIGTIIATAFLVQFMVQYSGGIEPFSGNTGVKRLGGTLLVFSTIWLVCLKKWPYKSQKYFYAFINGTLLTFALLACKNLILNNSSQNPFVMAVAVVTVVLLWRMLFGPWQTSVKATMIGTFIGWVTLHLLFKQPAEARFAYIITILIAAIPAAIWCALFLEYHKQRIGLVITMFFAGILSTAPILFYDKLVRSGVELHFFVFKIVPESFIGSSNAFINSLAGDSTVQTKIMASLVSFMLVGLIEECSKFWVLKKAGGNEFTSIDDVLQLAIMTAIGFAFAENILNPSYFLGFVREYILNPQGAQWSAFLANVLGRSVLTNMVHIVSTGVLGYFFGVMLFARPYLEDAHMQGKKLRVLHMLQAVFHMPEKLMFKRRMLFVGLIISIVLHGMFNFIVTLPELLPGSPQTLGDLLGSPTGAMTHRIALLMVPSLLYVVGGFWVLSTLFYRKESIKERGHLYVVDAYLPTPTAV